MKTTSTILIISFLLLVISISCDEEDEGPELTLDGIENIQGNWNATRAIYSSTALGPIQEVDIVTEGGTVTLNIQSNGRFTLVVTELGLSPETTTGSLGFDEDALVVIFDEEPDEFYYYSLVFTSNTLSISGSGAEYDFDGNGTLEEAFIVFDFERA